MPERLVVVGGGAAGMSAASAARRVNPALEVVVVEAAGDAAWGLCGLPYYVEGLVPAAEDLWAHPPSEFRDHRGIDLRLHTRATRVDPVAGRVTLEESRGKESRGRTSELSFDRLVLAAGAAPVQPAWAVGGNVRQVRSLDDGRSMRAQVDRGEVHRALVVGAGYIGLEMADALAARGVDVVVVELLDRVLPNLDRACAAPVEQEIRAHVDLRLDTAVVAVEAGPTGIHVTTTRGDLDVDLVVCAIGARPAGTLLAGVADATEQGALLVDDRMRTSVPGILAAGDCVALPHLVTGRPTYVPLGPAANRAGRVAGTVAAGADARFPGVVGTAVVKVFGLTVARTGLSDAEARAAGFDPQVTDVTHRSRAKYYPGSEPVRVRLVAEQNGRLLGGQMVSADPATAKRIDVLAAALHARMDLDEVAGLDLSYSPPYAPVYDPVVQAAATAAGRRLPAPAAAGSHH